MYYIRKRKIYAYISEIIGITQDKHNSKWMLFYDCIWNDNGCPMRSAFNSKKFDTEDDARRLKVGDVIDEKTIYW